MAFDVAKEAARAAVAAVPVTALTKLLAPTRRELEAAILGPGAERWLAALAAEQKALDRAAGLDVMAPTWSGLHKTFGDWRRELLRLEQDPGVVAYRQQICALQEPLQEVETALWQRVGADDSLSSDFSDFDRRRWLPPVKEQPQAVPPEPAAPLSLEQPVLAGAVEPLTCQQAARLAVKAIETLPSAADAEAVLLALMARVGSVQAGEPTAASGELTGETIVKPEGGSWPHVTGAEVTLAERDAMFLMRHGNGIKSARLAEIVGLSRQRINQLIGPARVQKSAWKDIKVKGCGWSPSADLLQKLGAPLQPLQALAPALAKQVRAA